MPPYTQFPCTPGTLNCGGANPGQFNVLDDLQFKVSERSPNSTNTPNTFGECGGTRQWCHPPAASALFFGSISHEIVSTAGAIQFDIPYDFPNAYCQNWADPDPAEWPTPFHNTTLRIYIGGVEQLQSPAIFEHGRWKPTISGIGCNASQMYSIQLWTCSGIPQRPTRDRLPELHGHRRPRKTASCRTSGPAPSAEAALERESAGLRVNVGSGDVSYVEPLFAISQSPASLAFNLTYHSEPPLHPLPIPSAVGLGWTHPFAQTLFPVGGSSAVLHHVTADGLDSEYSQAGSVWNASRPAELRGQVTLVGSEYRLTDLNGTVTAFDVPTGHWKSTTSRWGNALTATYTTGQLTRVTDSMAARSTSPTAPTSSRLRYRTARPGSSP